MLEAKEECISLKYEDDCTDVSVLMKSAVPCPDVEIDRSNSIWIISTHDGRHSLQENERLIIEQGGELTDKHISFAQNLIKT